MTFFNINTTRLMVSMSGIILSLSVVAHERFLLPSHTLLSGDENQSVTLISSISNAIFHPDMALGESDKNVDVGEFKNLFNLLEHNVIDPKGVVSKNTHWQSFARMSVADVALKASGTYRIGLNQPDIYMSTFKKADGTPFRLFGKNPKIPEGATGIVRRTTSSRVETFVTLNTPTMASVQPEGKGIELAGETHPNDLFENEEANFQLFFNGKPLATNAEVKLIKAGTRHRSLRAVMIIPVTDEGKISFTPKSAGFYLLSATTSVNKPKEEDVDVKHFSLYLTLEVFPE